MTNPDNDALQEAARQYAIAMMRERQDIFEDDLLLTELISDEDEDDDLRRSFHPDRRDI